MPAKLGLNRLFGVFPLYRGQRLPLQMQAPSDLARNSQGRQPLAPDGPVDFSLARVQSPHHHQAP